MPRVLRWSPHVGPSNLNARECTRSLHRAGSSTRKQTGPSTGAETWHVPAKEMVRLFNPPLEVCTLYHNLPAPYTMNLIYYAIRAGTGQRYFASLFSPPDLPSPYAGLPPCSRASWVSRRVICCFWIVSSSSHCPSRNPSSFLFSSCISSSAFKLTS